MRGFLLGSAALSPRGDLKPRRGEIDFDGRRPFAGPAGAFRAPRLVKGRERGTRCGLTSYPRAIPCRSCDACAERLPPVRLADLLHSTREMRRKRTSVRPRL